MKTTTVIGMDETNRSTIFSGYACMQPVSYESLRKRIWRSGLHMCLNELRDYYATFMVHNGLIREKVDLLPRRFGKSIFVQHYFSPNVEDLTDRVPIAGDRIQQNWVN